MLGKYLSKVPKNMFQVFQQFKALKQSVPWNSGTRTLEHRNKLEQTHNAVTSRNAGTVFRQLPHDE